MVPLFFMQLVGCIHSSTVDLSCWITTTGWLFILLERKQFKDHMYVQGSWMLIIYLKTKPPAAPSYFHHPFTNWQARERKAWNLIITIWGWVWYRKRRKWIFYMNLHDNILMVRPDSMPGRLWFGGMEWDLPHTCSWNIFSVTSWFGFLKLESLGAVYL